MTEQTADELLGLPFDLYERYLMTSRIVSVLDDDAAWSILDVGGHSSPLKQFLPDHRITLLDVEPPGSLTHLPLRCDASSVRSSA
jgi:hypothetical protein